MAGRPRVVLHERSRQVAGEGKCSDFNRLKRPVLRGLAGRAPYFHNGAAATLLEVVRFHDQRFRMGLTAQEKRRRVAFLSSL